MDSNQVFGFIIIVLINKQKHNIYLLYINKNYVPQTILLL